MKSVITKRIIVASLTLGLITFSFNEGCRTMLADFIDALSEVTPAEYNPYTSETSTIPTRYYDHNENCSYTYTYYTYETRTMWYSNGAGTFEYTVPVPHTSSHTVQCCIYVEDEHLGYLAGCVIKNDDWGCIFVNGTKYHTNFDGYSCNM